MPRSTLAEIDDAYLRRAISLSRHCHPSAKAFSVGAVLVDRRGHLVSTGYSRETDEISHAEEVALEKAAALGRNIAGGSLYSSLEPCGRRLSKPKGCAELILEAGIRRVVFALSEPSIFVEATGADTLRAGGVEVIVVDRLAPLVEEVNRHLVEAARD